MGFGRFLWYAIVLTVSVAVLQAYDERLAYGLAIITLLALFFTNPAALNEIQKLLGASHTTVANPGREP